jgi:four helix bundle protein
MRLCNRDCMPTITSFRDLLVWQKSLDLSVRIYRMARKLPRDEQGAIGYQLRKTAVSIPSNVAEGCARHSKASYINHLWIAYGSGAELETQIELARRVALIPEPDCDLVIADAQEIGRMINGLVRSLERTT